MFRKSVTTLVLLGAALALPVAAQSQNQPTPPPTEAPCAHHKGKKCGPDGERPFWKQLNLNEEQKAKLKAMRDEQAPKRKANQEKMAELRSKIRQEMLKDKPDQGALDKYASQVGDLHKQMAMTRTAHMLKIKQILSKEQFAQMVDKDDHRMGAGKGPCPMGDSAKCCPHKGGKGKCRGPMQDCPRMETQNPPAEGQ